MGEILGRNMVGTNVKYQMTKRSENCRGFISISWASNEVNSDTDKRNRKANGNESRHRDAAEMAEGWAWVARGLIRILETTDQHRPREPQALQYREQSPCARSYTAATPHI